jgi:hypothetical protein
VLAGKHVADDRHIPVLVASPLNFRGVGAWELLALKFLGICEGLERWFVPGNIEVFVQEVKDEFEELFGVLLFVDAPGLVEFTTYFLSKVSDSSNGSSWGSLLGKYLGGQSSRRL